MGVLVGPRMATAETPEDPAVTKVGQGSAHEVTTLQQARHAVDSRGFRVGVSDCAASLEVGVSDPGIVARLSPRVPLEASKLRRLGSVFRFDVVYIEGTLIVRGEFPQMRINPCEVLVGNNYRRDWL